MLRTVCYLNGLYITEKSRPSNGSGGLDVCAPITSPAAISRLLFVEAITVTPAPISTAVDNFEVGRALKPMCGMQLLRASTKYTTMLPCASQFIIVHQAWPPNF